MRVCTEWTIVDKHKLKYICTVILQKFSTGDLLLSLKCSRSHQKLQGIILKAVNLPKPHMWGMAGMYKMLLWNAKTLLVFLPRIWTALNTYILLLLLLTKWHSGYSVDDPFWITNDRQIVGSIYTYIHCYSLQNQGTTILVILSDRMKVWQSISK